MQPEDNVTISFVVGLASTQYKCKEQIDQKIEFLSGQHKDRARVEMSRNSMRPHFKGQMAKMRKWGKHGSSEPDLGPHLSFSVCYLLGIREVT